MISGELFAVRLFAAGPVRRNIDVYFPASSGRLPAAQTGCSARASRSAHNRRAAIGVLPPVNPSARHSSQPEACSGCASRNDRRETLSSIPGASSAPLRGSVEPLSARRRSEPSRPMSREPAQGTRDAATLRRRRCQAGTAPDFFLRTLPRDRQRKTTSCHDRPAPLVPWREDDGNPCSGSQRRSPHSQNPSWISPFARE